MSTAFLAHVELAFECSHVDDVAVDLAVGLVVVVLCACRCEKYTNDTSQQIHKGTKIVR